MVILILLIDRLIDRWGETMKIGMASMRFEKPPCIIGAASVVGKKEGEGPLGSCFDQVEENDLFVSAKNGHFWRLCRMHS